MAQGPAAAGRHRPHPARQDPDRQPRARRRPAALRALRLHLGAVTKPGRPAQAGGTGVVYETYACSARRERGLAYCDQPPVPRRPIDEAILRFFTDVALDLDATRAAITEAHHARLAEIAALRHQADQEAARAQARLARVRADYADGKIDADEWRSVTARTAVATTRPDPSANYRYAARSRRVWLVRDAAGEADRVHLGGLAM